MNWVFSGFGSALHIEAETTRRTVRGLTAEWTRTACGRDVLPYADDSFFPVDAPAFVLPTTRKCARCAA